MTKRTFQFIRVLYVLAGIEILISAGSAASFLKLVEKGPAIQLAKCQLNLNVSDIKLTYFQHNLNLTEINEKS